MRWVRCGGAVQRLVGGGNISVRRRLAAESMRLRSSRRLPFTIMMRLLKSWAMPPDKLAHGFHLVALAQRLFGLLPFRHFLLQARH